MNLSQMALHIDERPDGTYCWRILGSAPGSTSFAQVVKVGSMHFEDAASALRSGYKAMLALGEVACPAMQNTDELEFH